jgi:hypothetical protein
MQTSFCDVCGGALLLFRRREESVLLVATVSLETANLSRVGLIRSVGALGFIAGRPAALDVGILASSRRRPESTSRRPSWTPHQEHL